MKKQPRPSVPHFRNSNFKQNEKTANPAKSCVRKVLRKQKNFK